MRNILITGGAGFIGSNLTDVLLQDRTLTVTCVDNFEPFYEPTRKRQNIEMHLGNPRYKLIELDIRNNKELKKKLNAKYDTIIHLAAKVGVRPSIKNPQIYTETNIIGTQNMLELAKEIKCKKFIFASSSSVYGVNPNIPWEEDEIVLQPISPYASTKVAGELLGHVYSHLYNIQFIGLRFFAVYGPRQRPDLAIHKFAKFILDGKPIPVYGDGKTRRDYTYIDDIVAGIMGAINYSQSQYEIINLGNNETIELHKLIALLEKILGKKAIIKIFPQQQGDVPVTFANIHKAHKLLGYDPKTKIENGLEKFVEWLKNRGTYK